MRRVCAASLFFLMALSAGIAQSTPGDQLRSIYHEQDEKQVALLLSQVVHFATVEGNEAARRDQQAWLRRMGEQMGLTVRDAGLVTEIELAGPEGAPVLGLVVHGDVQPVDASEWRYPPFAGVVKDGTIYGRGVADDKGPLVQALLAMKALQQSGLPLTHTIRLLVGSDEESNNLDIAQYLKDHKPPYLTLVLDSGFPVVAGEKAWNALAVTAKDPYLPKAQTKVAANAHAGFWAVTKLDAGLAASIVPSAAMAELRWTGPIARRESAIAELRHTAVFPGYKLDVSVTEGNAVHVLARGRAAHSGVNIEGGRNALVFLARTLDGKLQPSGAADLLDFARQAGADLYGSGLGINVNDPLWGHFDVNVATIKPAQDDPHRLTLTINIRSFPPLEGVQLRAAMDRQVEQFNRAHQGRLTTGGFFGDKVLAFDPESKIVQRLMADYERVTGRRDKPAISGGGTYAKRLPNAIAFGMWFPGKPYPGHDVDEQITLADLNRGVDVLLEALADLALQAPMERPFEK